MVVALLVAQVASAETVATETIEWRTDDAEVVVRGTVETAGPADARLVVVEALKGAASGVLDVRHAGDWPTGATDVAVFLRRDAGAWVVARERVIDLARPRWPVVDADFDVLDGEAIVRAIRARAAVGRTVSPRPPGSMFGPMRGWLRVEVPYEAPAFRALWGGSSVYAIVPADPRWRPMALALARSESPRDREQAAYMLGNYPGPDVVAVLRALLEDPYVAEWRGSGGAIVDRTHPVREAARTALGQLGP